MHFQALRFLHIESEPGEKHRQDSFIQPVANLADLLGLRWAGCLSSADGPNGLVSNGATGNLIGSEAGESRRQLGTDHFCDPTCISFIECFTHAQKIGSNAERKAASTLRLTVALSSPKTVRRSECPTMT